MTNPDYTALLFIIDRSGSMYTIANDMEGGITTLLEEQKEIEGQVTVDLAYFDDKFEYAQEMASLTAAVPSIKPRGMTALYDAVGKAVTQFGTSLANLDEDDRPGKVLVVIVTDGLENASQEYTSTSIKDIITEQREKYNWEFVFLGANQDAVLVGGNMGIPSRSAMTYVADSAGVANASANLRGYTRSFRTNQEPAFDINSNDTE
mgnify:CR=1 FL=1